MSDGIGLAEALLGLDGFRVLEVHETTDEVVISVKTTARIAWCGACGARAAAHDRRTARTTSPDHDDACAPRDETHRSPSRPRPA